MIILQPGKKIHGKFRFICGDSECRCEWLADETEVSVSTAYSPFVFMDCPFCGRETEAYTPD